MDVNCWGCDRASLQPWFLVNGSFSVSLYRFKLTGTHGGRLKACPMLVIERLLHLVRRNGIRKELDPTSCAISAYNAVHEQPQGVQGLNALLLLQPRNAQARRDDIESKIFGLQKSYEAYGSSNGDGRNIKNNKRWTPHPGHDDL